MYKREETLGNWHFVHIMPRSKPTPTPDRDAVSLEDFCKMKLQKSVERELDIQPSISTAHMCTESPPVDQIPFEGCEHFEVNVGDVCVFHLVPIVYAH